MLALLATEPGLTKAQIFQTVRGYDHDSAAGVSAEALDRKFERDKDDLRDLGIPLETIESPDAVGDNTQLRYRIRKDEYDLPDDIEFTGAELALLNLAGEVWREGTVSNASQRALLKLRSFDIEPDAPVLGLVPRLRTREACFDAFNAAVTEHRVVRFPYLKPGDAAPSERVLTPYALGLRDGNWLVRGFDHDRGEERTFLLSRVSGNIRNDPATPHEVPENAAEELMRQLDALYAERTASVLVRLGSAAHSQLRNREASQSLAILGDTERLEVHYTDQRILAEELAGCGPEVIVESPAELREDVIGILRSVVAAHGGAAR